MKVISSTFAMQSLAESLRMGGKKIGFVPTMGFLHEGHLSLMRRARKECDVVIVSIFVNPTQFGPNEDYDHYPRDAEGDRKKCESAGIDILFVPSAAEMYQEKTPVFINVERISDILEGTMRPGHFRAVATVVAKLFHIVKPHRAYFGQKDYQQCVVIKYMVKGLNMDVEIVVLPTVREPDGLAMSSRNIYLSADERRAAVSIARALSTALELIKAGVCDVEKIKNKTLAVLREEKSMTVDYVEIADPDTLEPLS